MARNSFGKTGGLGKTPSNVGVPKTSVSPVHVRLVKNNLVPGNRHAQADGAAALARVAPLGEMTKPIK